jgi:hypothetical protein
MRFLAGGCLPAGLTSTGLVSTGLVLGLYRSPRFLSDLRYPFGNSLVFFLKIILPPHGLWPPYSDTLGSLVVPDDRLVIGPLRGSQAGPGAIPVVVKVERGVVIAAEVEHRDIPRQSPARLTPDRPRKRAHEPVLPGESRTDRLEWRAMPHRRQAERQVQPAPILLLGRSYFLADLLAVVGHVRPDLRNAHRQRQPINLFVLADEGASQPEPGRVKQHDVVGGRVANHPLLIFLGLSAGTCQFWMPFYYLISWVILCV